MPVKYQANPYAQPAKRSTVKYLGSYQSTQQALPQSNLNALNRMYMRYRADQQPPPGEQPKQSFWEKVSNLWKYTPRETPDLLQPGQSHNRYAPLMNQGYGTAGSYLPAAYAPRVGAGLNRSSSNTPKYVKGTPETTAAYFGNPKPMWPYYNFTGPTDPISTMYQRYRGWNPVMGSGSSGEGPGIYDRRFVQGQYGAKFRAYTPQENPGYTNLNPPIQEPGYGGGLGNYGYPGYGGGGGGGGGYTQRAPSGAAAQGSGTPNVQARGQGDNPGQQPGYRLPQWYRKLLTWNF